MVLSDDLRMTICLRTAEGESMRAICRDPAMPSRSKVQKELVENSAFADQYARARELLYAVWADEILEIADDGTTDYITKVGRNGHEYEAVDQEHIQRSRLRVDARKWLLSKLMPKQFGDKVQHDYDGEVAVKHDITALPNKEKMRRFALFMLEDQQANGPASPVVVDGNVIRSHDGQPDDDAAQRPIDKTADPSDQPANE